MRHLFVAAMTSVTLFFSGTTVTAQFTQIGFQADLSDLSTVGISGTIEIINDTTIRFHNFNYDGRGGGLTELALLPDRDAITLRNNNVFGTDNGSRATLINGVPTPIGGAGLDPLNPPNGVEVPPVEFDQAFRVASIRGPDSDPGVDAAEFPGFSPSTPGGGDSPPFVNFNGDLDLSQISDSGINGDSFGDNGESLTDFAGFSIFCIPFGIDFGSGIFTAPSDFTNDGLVNAADFVLARDTLGAGNVEPGQLGDADFDGEVTSDDLAIFFQQFGTVAAAASPGTAAGISEFNDHSNADFGQIAEELAALAAVIDSLPEGSNIGDSPFFPPSTAFPQLNLSSSATAIPEPTAIGLMLLGLCVTMTQRCSKSAIAARRENSFAVS